MTTQTINFDFEHPVRATGTLKWTGTRAMLVGTLDDVLRWTAPATAGLTPAQGIANVIAMYPEVIRQVANEEQTRLVTCALVAAVMANVSGPNGRPAIIYVDNHEFEFTVRVRLVEGQVQIDTKGVCMSSPVGRVH